MIHYYHC